MKRIEEVAADPKSVGVARLAARRQIKRSCAPRKYRREALLTLANPLQNGIGKLRSAALEITASSAWWSEPDLRQLLRIWHRKRAQPHRIDQLKYRGVRADTEGKRKHGNQ